MARIIDSLGRVDENSGYARLFGNDRLGKLFSRAQAAVIRSGNELEDLLWQATPYKASLEDIFDKDKRLLGGQQTIFVVSAKKIAEYNRMVPRTDLLILDDGRGDLVVVELKDGDTFDTKKADGELESAKTFTAWITPQVDVSVKYYFCSFNQSDKAAIIKGIKGRFALDQVQTGRELCERIGVDYDGIRLARHRDQVENREFFIKELLAIPEIKELVQSYLENAE